MTPFEQIRFHRGRPGPGPSAPHQWVELHHGKPVLLSFYAPDANTCHESFYYNTREDKLFKKMKAGKQFVWKEISEPPGDRAYQQLPQPVAASPLAGYGFNYGGDYGGGL